MINKEQQKQRFRSAAAFVAMTSFGLSIIFEIHPKLGSGISMALIGGLSIIAIALTFSNKN